MKKLVIVFSKKNHSGSPFEFLDYPYMIKIFYDLFNLFTDNGLEIYICRDINNIISNKEFKVLAKYNKEKGFELITETIEADIVWDRTNNFSFPIPRNDNSVDLLNTMEYKLITKDKWLSYSKYKEYYPKTILLSDLTQINNYFDLLPSEKFVIKPISGFGGKAVTCFNKSDIQGLSKYLIDNNVVEGQYILQEFYDVKSGIKGLVEGIHDMRIISTNNKIIFSYIRKPSNPEEFRSNFSVGGTMEEIDSKNLPSEIVSFVQPIISDAYTNYENPFFSIDLFLTKSGPKIIEITGSSLGFPMPDMNLKPFYTHLVERFTK